MGKALIMKLQRSEVVPEILSGGSTFICQPRTWTLISLSERVQIVKFEATKLLFQPFLRSLVTASREKT